MYAIEEKIDTPKYLMFWTTGILDMEVNCLAEALSGSKADLAQLNCISRDLTKTVEYI